MIDLEATPKVNVTKVTGMVTLAQTPDSGFDKSIADSKDGLKYTSPLPPLLIVSVVMGKVFMCYQMVRRMVQVMLVLNLLCLLH